MSGNNILKDTNNTTYVPMDNRKFEYVLANLQKCIVPGTFVRFEGDYRSYLVEKVYKDSLLLSYYHYTNTTSDKNPEDLKYVKSTKMIFGSEDLKKYNVTGIHLPNWADKAYEKIKEVNGPEYVKESRLNLYSKSDSPELVSSLVDFIKSKYGVKVNIIHNKDLSKFNDPKVYQSAAFAARDGIYINIDKASIEEPLHELLHLVLATMKGRNPNTYYQLVNSVQSHPMFKQVSAIYGDQINTEQLEETFVKLLSSTFRRNILKEGVFNDTTFSVAIKESIKELMDLSKDLSWKDPFDLLRTPVNQILFDFESKLVDNEESLIDDSIVGYMYDISEKIESLLNNGDLNQKCDF